MSEQASAVDRNTRDGKRRAQRRVDPLRPLPSPDSVWQRLVGGFVGITIGLFLFFFLIALNGLQILSLVIVPFSRRAFRRFNRQAADMYWSICVWAAQVIWGTRPVMTGDSLPYQENALCMSNHQQMPDITFLMFPAKEHGRLGDMKWVLKKVIKYVPGVGWGLAFLDCVFLERNWSSDEAAMKKTFAHLRDHDVPVWLMIFPEGTRVKPEKLKRARQYARSIGQEPLDHLLWPRTKGFVACVKGTAGHVKAVYDFTIGYEEGLPTLAQYVEGFVRRAHIHVRRFPVEDLPTDDQALADWLVARFRDKDRLLAHFYEKGRFPDSFDDLDRES